MSSLRRAAEVLTGSSSPRGAQQLVALLRFAEALPLDRDARERLGIAGEGRRASVAAGTGSLRCCVVSASAEQPARLVAARCAARLTERSPHLLWLVTVVHPASHTVILVLPPAVGSRRTSALVVDTRRVQDSDAETVAAMADAAEGGDVMIHHRWHELLGRDALTRRFYRELEGTVGALASTARGAAPDPARRELALLCASRLLFLAFLEAKGWLDGDREFLRHRFDERCAHGGDVHRRLLEPLFFGTLNTPLHRRARASRALGRVPFLNGGLFERAPIERRWRSVTLTDDGVGRMVCGLLGKFRVTAREESVSWSEAAIDPEMLGRAFESLMASDERKRSGAFYTPLALIERVTSAGIDEWLAARGIAEATREAVAQREPIARPECDAILESVGAVRVLDPACGSGAFLVHAMERLADIREAAGDRRPASTRRREVLTRSIFGVDLNPVAVWLCELRLWLSTVIDAADTDGMGVAPLPNLDHNVRIGDALAGSAFDEALASREGDGLAFVRRRYARATGRRKRTLGRSLDALERRIALDDVDAELNRCAARRRDLLAALRGRDLFARRIEPSAAQRQALAALRTSAHDARNRRSLLRDGGALSFSFRTHFADVAASGGFDLIVGNPPWVRVHRIGHSVRSGFAERFRSWREAAWAEGSRAAGTGRGFASQVDLSALFVERATQVARHGAAISLLVPAKLWTSLAGGGIRRVLLDTCRLRRVEDWSESPAAFEAVVYPSLIVAVKSADAPTRCADRGLQPTAPTVPICVRGAVHRGRQLREWTFDSGALPLDESDGAPWLVIPPAVRTAFDRLVARGECLSRTSFGRPLLGVKTGCNDAFIVTPEPGWLDAERAHGATWRVGAASRDGSIELAALRPVLRGEHVRPWCAGATTDAIVWTHGPDGTALRRLGPRATAWLAPWRRRLEGRTDAARGARHWTLFRTESADCRRARVVWSDISRLPRAAVLLPGDPTVALNSCYVANAPSLDDALALAALLNSAPAAGWLCALAEPARGGYRRFLGWTVARLPLPLDWSRAVALLAPLGRAAIGGTPPGADALAGAVADAYGLGLAQLEPLLDWCLR